MLSDSFIFGLVSSLHCAGMCGPLASCFVEGRIASIAYHGLRLCSYSLLGAIAGSFGASLGAEQLGSAMPVVAWVLAGALIVFALFGESWLRVLPGGSQLANRVLRRAYRAPPLWRAGVLGAVTPLLPCGVLYVAIAAAAVSGSWSEGLVVTSGLALGSVPLLLLFHTQLHRLRRKLGVKMMTYIQKGIMLAAAGALVWRSAAGPSGCCGH